MTISLFPRSIPVTPPLSQTLSSFFAQWLLCSGSCPPFSAHPGWSQEHLGVGLTIGFFNLGAYKEYFCLDIFQMSCYIADQ